MSPSFMRVSPGIRLGPYEVVAPLASGGMGEVWRARDTRLDRSVAVKVLPSQLAGNEQFRLRFEREARTISQLNHPNICTLHDVGENYLVMELLDGETLADRLARGPLPLNDVLRYAIEIAKALEAAHGAGVVHRDLKPGNVMLTKHGAKLLDFGLAKEDQPPALASMTEATVQRPLTEEGTIVGTFQYMAPEQLEGGAVDQRTDIFAFGALVYEMAAGRRAFEGRKRASLIAAILATTPQPIAATSPTSPRALDRLVRACLAKDPAERFQSIHDVRLELEWLAEAVTETETTAAGGRRAGIQRLLPWALAALFAAFAIFAGAALLNRRDSATRHPVRSTILPPQDAAITAGASGASVEISPDGRHVVFSATRGGTQSLWIRSLDSAAPRMLEGTSGGALPFWSPDSAHVAFFVAGVLKRVPLRGGTPVTVCKVAAARGGSWGAKGTIVFAERYSPIFKVPAAGGTPAAVTKLQPDQRSHRWPQFLPDGERFVFLASRFGSEEESNVMTLGSIDGAVQRPILKSAARAVLFRDHFLVVRDGALTAQRFDSDDFELLGEPLQLDYANIAGDPLLARYEFSVSANGTLVLSIGGPAKGQLTWFDREGSEIGRLGAPESYRHVALSPDGKSVLASIQSGSSANLWQLDVARGVRTRLTDGPGVDLGVVFSPDGRRIAHSTYAQGGSEEIFVRDLLTGEWQRLVTAPGDESPTSWSNDGTLLLYNMQIANRQNAYDIGVYSFAERKSFAYRATPHNELSARFSPDGKWVAYASDESGKFEIYVAPFPADGRKWQVSTEGGTSPRWSQNGRELLYTANVRMHSVKIGFTPDPQMENPVPLFSLRPAMASRVAWTATDDGQRFLISTQLASSAQAEGLTLVQNFDVALEAHSE